MTEKEMKDVVKEALYGVTAVYRMHRRDTSKPNSSRGEILHKNLILRAVNIMRKNVDEAIKSCYKEKQYDIALYGEDFLSIFSQATFNWVKLMDEDTFYSRIELMIERATNFIEQVVMDDG